MGNIYTTYTRRCRGVSISLLYRISEMGNLHETLHVMDQCFFNLYQKGPSIFGYTYLLYVTYKNK